MATSDARLTIRRAADGTLFVRPYLGTNPVTGRKVQPYHALEATTMAEAEVEAAEWYATIMGNPLLSVALDGYVDALEEMGSPANTVATYRNCARMLKPLVSRVRVRDLTTRNCTDAYRELMDHGGADGDGLSANTVRQCHWFLRGAYNWLCDQGMATTNPTVSAAKPGLVQHEAVWLDEFSLATLRDALSAQLDGRATARLAEPGPWERNVAMAAWLALVTGMRCGEACGVRRRDVQGARGFLHVGGTAVEAPGGVRYQERTKGKRSRNVSLREADVATIRAHVRWQGTLFSGGADTPIVSEGGAMCRPSRVARAFSAMARELGLPEGTHFHTLRHTHASMLIASGVDLKTVSERLGHASASTTTNIYAHVLPGRDEAAARAFGDVLDGL